MVWQRKWRQTVSLEEGDLSRGRRSNNLYVHQNERWYNRTDQDRAEPTGRDYSVFFQFDTCEKLQDVDVLRNNVRIIQE